MPKENLQLYFRRRHIGEEQPTDDEQAAIDMGKRARERGDVVTLDEWRHAMGLGNH
jgi:hypothetical protein